MAINNLHKNFLFVIILISLLGGSAPILMAATSWQSLIDGSGLELGIEADHLNSLSVEKQQELETKLRLIGAGKSWEDGDFEKGAQAFGRIVALSPFSPSIKGIDFLKLALVGTGIKIIIEAPKITLVHFYIANREQGLADSIAWQKAIEPSLASCQEWGTAQLNETFPVCPLLEDKEKLASLHQSAQFIWAGVELYHQYQDQEQLKNLRQWILSEIGAGQKLQQTTGFFSSLWQAFTHSVKTAYTSVKDFFTGATSQKDKMAIQPSDLSGQISNALSRDVDNEIPAIPSTPAPSITPPSQEISPSISPPILSEPQPSVREDAVILRHTVGCDKRPVDVPPPNFKYPYVSMVNIKLDQVNPFVNLEWGSVDMSKNSGAQYKVYRNGELMLPGVWFDQPSFGDGSVITGTTYTYLVKTEYLDGSIQDSEPLKVAVPKDICGVVPYVNLKVNGTDGYVVASPLSAKFDVELTTFVGSENEGYGPCYKFAGDGGGGSWGMIMEPQDIYSSFDHETIYTYDHAPFLYDQSMSIICPTKEEEKQFLNTVSGFYITLPEVLSINLNPVNLMRMLASGLWLENRPQTGNFFGCWGCDLTLTHLLPYRYVLEAVQKFRPRADAVQAVFSQYSSSAPVEIVTKNFRPCQQSIKRGNFLDLEAAMAGEPERLNSATAILSTDNNLDIKDIILGEVLHPVQLLQKCGNFDIVDHSFYIPDTISAGNYFIGLLFRDGQQVAAPLVVE